MLRCSRLNRYISKTFFSLQVGIPLILDDDVPLEESLSGDSLFNNSFSISCYQLYDVTLTQGQIERAMDLCRADGKVTDYSEFTLFES